MVQRYLQSFLTQIDWGRLDYLLVDMPPGTGDAQLALAQTAPVAGTVIVTTPQDVSLNVARRGMQMFRQAQVPVLGVVENMSYFIGDDGKRYDIFRTAAAGSWRRSRACRSWARSRSTRAWRSAATWATRWRIDTRIRRRPRRTWRWRRTWIGNCAQAEQPRDLPEVRL